MVRRQANPVHDEQLEDMFLPKITGSEILRPHIEHYERCYDGHPDRSYKFLVDMAKKTVDDRRQTLNAEYLAIGGGNVTPRRTTMLAPTNPNDNAGSGDNVPATRDKPNEDKGKGKGKGPKTTICPWFLKGSCRHKDVKVGESCERGVHKANPTKEDYENPTYLRLLASDAKKKARAEAANAKTAAPAETAIAGEQTTDDERQ